MFFDFEEEISFFAETVGLQEELALDFLGSNSLEAAGFMRRTAIR